MDGETIPKHDPKSTRYCAEEHIASLNLCGVFWGQFTQIFKRFNERVKDTSIDEQLVYSKLVSIYMIYVYNEAHIFNCIIFL